MQRSGKPVWELTRITKSFPGVKANDNVSLAIYPGEIHALLGANGCGKTTLIKIFSGVYQPDAGTILLAGKPVKIETPTVARSHGIATVFQEFSLVSSLTVMENIFLGRQPVRDKSRIVRWNIMRHAATRILESLEIEIDPDQEVGTLSVSGQQLVEIAKAFAADASMIILDEPTTALGADEIANLHRLLRHMAQRGKSMLYVSHRLDEVVDLVDSVTILKDGQVVSTAEESEIDLSYIVKKMVGEEVKDYYPKVVNKTDIPILEVHNISSANKVTDVSFSVHRGEVFGLGGVLGSGRTEIARAIFGIDSLVAGTIHLHGRPVSIRSPQDAIRVKIAYVTESRKIDGLFFNFEGPPNISIANLSAVMKRGLIQPRKEDRVGLSYIDKLDISPESQTKLVGLLSGGNQQKVILSRWLFSQADIFILDEPTQGIDIGAKIALFHLVNELTAQNKGVILISSDHDELLAMSDRIGIVRDGRIVQISEAKDLRHEDLVQGTVEKPLSENVNAGAVVPGDNDRYLTLNNER
ncbi:ABC transporter, ATP-binding protein (cluster 2, ribose/xylose/arabinose/galactose) / ABC transporter, ATP-binding protein (cluster 2, ribose/xylose/arabinose/galactose) [Olavius sp. associated proteobacterium Delta 1]|nr:ABC transporter, ATP-binding protein (cluster 2, ribose/xylose/arabinose/galactose) / ABC transporter, ATP-binding protein (cluster 2, ribose/xylose/arabinose/galactose) [Olavius sp. associated proteobacterium Delta 1]